MSRPEVDPLQRDQVAGEEPRGVGRAERGGMGGVAGLAAGRQLQHHQALLRDRHVEAGGLAHDRGLDLQSALAPAP